MDSGQWTVTVGGELIRVGFLTMDLVLTHGYDDSASR